MTTGKYKYLLYSINLSTTTHLIFAFENEDIGDTAERHSEMDNLSLRHFVGDVSDVDNPRKLAIVALVEFNLRNKRHRSEANLEQVLTPVRKTFRKIISSKGDFLIKKKKEKEKKNISRKHGQ